jgi:hypothetical protein
MARAAAVLGRSSGLRRKTTARWARAISGKEREKGVPLRVSLRVGRGPILWLGRKAFRGLFPFLFFYFFLFLISISLISFAKRHQINSNQFLKFSKNQHNVFKIVRKLVFRNKTRFPRKFLIEPKGFACIIKI